MSSYTLIIPTHGRHAYLHRTLDFYSDINAPVLYCDSSARPYKGSMPSNFRYLHLPALSFSEKMLRALNIVETPFVSLCADDDFILHGALTAGAEFLQAHPTHKTVIGHCLSFPASFEGKFTDSYLHNRGADILEADLTARVKAYFGNYFILLWAMHDKQTLRRAFTCYVESGIANEKLLELMIGLFACDAGGIRVLPRTWGVREAPVQRSWRDEDPRLGNLSPESRKDFARAVDEALGTEIGDFAFECYLKHHLKRHPDAAQAATIRDVAQKVKRRIAVFAKTAGFKASQEESHGRPATFPPQPEKLESDSAESDAAELRRISRILSASQENG